MLLKSIWEKLFVMHWRMVGGLYGTLHIYWKTYWCFFRVLFFNRNNVHLFALRSQYFLWIVLRISKEDSHFWTEPTKRDESFSLFLCSAVLWLLLSQTLCPVVKSDATDLEGCGTHSLPKSVIYYLPCCSTILNPSEHPIPPTCPAGHPQLKGRGVTMW